MGVSVNVHVGVHVGVCVVVTVLVIVGESVGVHVNVHVGVHVGVCVGVCVGVSVGVAVGDKYSVSSPVAHMVVYGGVPPVKNCWYNNVSSLANRYGSTPLDMTVEPESENTSLANVTPPSPVTITVVGTSVIYVEMNISVTFTW